MNCALMLVAALGLMEGSYWQAARDHGPGQCAVLLAYFALVAGLVAALGPTAYLSAYLDYVLVAAACFALVVAAHFSVIVSAEAAPEFKARWAAKVARRAEEGKPPPRRRSRLKQALKSALPTLLIIVVVMFYVFAIHPLHAACDTDLQRVAVYALSLVLVKSGGEKVLKYLLERVLPKVPETMADFLLFGYELNMSVQARLLLLSTPNPSVVFATSVLTALWEVGLRLFFIFRFSKRCRQVKAQAALVVDLEQRLGEDEDSGGDDAKLATELKVAAARLRRMERLNQRESAVLTANTGGDMVVEYLSANMAMAILVGFGDSRAAFRFQGGAPSKTLVALALAAQHVPELVCDAVATMAEVRAGLPVREYFEDQLTWRVLPPKAGIVLLTVFLVLGTMRTWDFVAVVDGIQLVS